MSEDKNNNNESTNVELVPETFREKYDKLTEGKKRLLIYKYKATFDACIRTFGNKINGRTRLRKVEEIFFLNNL